MCNKQRNASRIAARARIGQQALTTAMAMIVTVPAFAQEDGAALEEITVTAQRYEQNLQRVPLAVSAFDTKALDEMGVKNVATLGQYVPNMVSNIGSRGDTASSGSVYIRGVGQSDSYPNADQGVGVYLDGVYLARWKGALYEINDIDRVEVLRGPQGTLYGKNTIGGALNVITAKPAADFDYNVGVGYGSFSAMEVEGMVNAPINDSLWFRAAVRAGQDDGYVENNFDGTDVGDRDHAGGRVMLRYRPGDDLDVNFAGEVHRDRSISVPLRMVAFDQNTNLFGQSVRTLIAYADAGVLSIPDSIRQLGSLGSYVLPPGGDPAEGGSYNHVGRNELDVYMGTLTVEKDLTSGLRLKSISSYRTYDATEIGDLDGSPFEAIAGDVEQDQWQASQEFQITGTAFDGRLSSVSGLYWFKEQSTNKELLIIAPDLISLAVDLQGDLGFGRGYQLSTLKSKQENTSAFTQATWSFTDRLRGTVGLRWTREQRELSNQVSYPNSEFSGARVAPPEKTFEAFTPRVGIDFNITEDALLYASAAKGFKSGQVSFRGADDAGAIDPVDPETVWSYEVGLKSRWLEDRLQVNLAAFHSDYKDMQLIVAVVDGRSNAPRTVVRNAGQATLQGAELEIITKPWSRLELIGSLGVLSSEYDEFLDIDQTTRLPVDRSGNDMPFAPRRSASAIVRYLQPLGNGANLTAQAGWNYRSETQLLTINTPNSLSDSFGLYDARLVYNSASGRFSASAYGENLTNEVYKVFALVPTLGISAANFGRPRSYGMRLNYRFR